jgi:hypothetical protein
MITNPLIRITHIQVKMKRRDQTETRDETMITDNDETGIWDETVMKQQH